MPRSHLHYIWKKDRKPWGFIEYNKAQEAPWDRNIWLQVGFNGQTSTRLSIGFEQFLEILLLLRYN